MRLPSSGTMVYVDYSSVNIKLQQHAGTLDSML
jgi:hypothetical protein